MSWGAYLVRGAPATVVAAALVTLIPFIPATLSAGTLQFILLVGCAVATTAGALSLIWTMRHKRGLSRLGMTIFAAGLPIAVVIPGAQLLSGSRVSLLARLRGPAITADHDLSLAYAIFLLALICFILGQEVAARLQRNTDLPATRDEPARNFDTPLAYICLLIVGGAALVVLDVTQGLQQIAEGRGTVRGIGYLTVPSWGVPLAISMGIVRHHWRSKWLAAVSTVGFVLLLLQSTSRSPLLLVALAAVLRLLQMIALRRHVAVRVVGIGLLLYVGSSIAVGLASWRADVAAGGARPLASYVIQGADDPIAGLLGSGLDTLDGMLLSIKVDPQRVGATWYDPVEAITSLVPYELWPSKPPDLAATVTHTYTDFGGESGLFLSGPGYLYIIWGGPAGVALGFTAIGFVSERLLTRWRTPTAMAVIFAYGLTRFIFGGGAFDLSNTLTLVILLVLAASLARLLGQIPARNRRPRSAPLAIGERRAAGAGGG